MHAWTNMISGDLIAKIIPTRTHNLYFYYVVKLLNFYYV